MQKKIDNKINNPKGGFKDLFKGMKMSIVIDKGNPSLRRPDLTKIIERMGGRVVSSECAKGTGFNVAITDEVWTDKHSKTSTSYQQTLISHRWILDSISNSIILDYSKYIL